MLTNVQMDQLIVVIEHVKIQMEVIFAPVKLVTLGMKNLINVKTTMSVQIRN